MHDRLFSADNDAGEPGNRCSPTVGTEVFHCNQLNFQYLQSLTPEEKEKIKLLLQQDTQEKGRIRNAETQKMTDLQKEHADRAARQAEIKDYLQQMSDEYEQNYNRTLPVLTPTHQSMYRELHDDCTQKALWSHANPTTAQ